MLLHLHVKNFALIEEAEIDFTEGLNVLTGETGAGKSILIDALSAALGGRIGAEVIRKGAESAWAELLFTVTQEKKAELLALGVEPEEDALIISRRILPGRNLCRINDETVTSSHVKAVTELLLDIHGQHEHQSLLKPAKQLEILDEYAGEACLKLKKQAAQAWQRLKDARQALSSFTLADDERIRRLDFLNYEMDEISQAAVRPGERGELESRHRKLSQFDRLQNALGAALTALDAGRESASDLTGRALRELQTAAAIDPRLKETAQELQTADELIGDIVRELSGYLSEARFDPEELSEIEHRIDLLNRLELKYGDLSDPANRSLAQREEEAEKLLRYEEEKKAAQAEAAAAKTALDEACLSLRKARMSAVPQLESAVTKALKELNFLSVSFRIALEALPEGGPGGQDEAVFLISLNPGEELQPLSKVASGGELSRIMLAIKTILADRDRIPTVIFDEIDSGISGRTAQAVGEKLKEISENRQVILITHLAQIAAPADRHIGIEKWTDGEKTYTDVHVLSEEESIEELARLLGGDRITENVMLAAAEMKKRKKSD
ncbi:MAG: DNA repair protein RecN [Lachnospiraceae bacterium]|nr:DNA repair protein RecN [Lachnospiraceae bacterium]